MGDDPSQRVQELERRLRRERELSGRMQQTIEDRVAALERSPIFRVLRWWETVRRGARTRAGQWLLHSRFHSLYLQAFPPPTSDPDLDRYLAAGLDRENAPRFNRAAPPLDRDPLFSILVATHNPRREWLEAAVRSVQEQTYANWELCICDDASAAPVRLDITDSRIHWTALLEKGGISRALNAAGALATGDYICVLDHDDLLAATALEAYAAALREVQCELLYSDEDRLNTEGNHMRPIFKPAWSPELLQECMYLCHFLCVSRAAIERAGWFRPEYDGAQDYDLVLRIAENDPVVCHVPRILYHWREHAGSTALDTAAKPWTHEAGRRALDDAARRRNSPTPVRDGARPNTYRVPWTADPPPLVSIVMCSRSTPLIERCLDAIRDSTNYANREIVVVRHLPDDGRGMERVLERHGAIVVEYRGAFHFARMSNLGAGRASGEVVLFLNDDVTPLAPVWLAALVEQAVRKHVGAVGARLEYPSGAIQHAGMAIGINDGVGHPHRGHAQGRYWGWHDVRREVTAVTGACLAMRREVFDELGGFDEAFPSNYNDVDLCLRARRAGYTVLYEPAARLRHDECATRTPGTHWQERELFHERWADALGAGDPYYNPNLDGEAATLRGI